MNENMPKFEKGPERIPTEEEIHLVFKELIGKEYTESLKREDEKGPYLLRVILPGDFPGEETEYEYMRKGRHSEGGGITATEIHVTYFKDGIPIGGTSAAKFVDGKWEIV